MSVRFLIDTGSTKTWLSDLVISQLRLPLVGTAQASVPNGLQRVDVYAADLLFAQLGLSIPGIEIRSFKQRSLSREGLLGRDVTDRLVLRIDGPRNELLLQF